MHQVLTGRPDWVESEEQIGNVRAQRDRVAAERMAKWEKYHQAMRTFRGKYEAAVLAGKPPPAPPTPPEEVVTPEEAASALADGAPARVLSDVAGYTAWEIRLREQQRDLLGRIAPEVEADAQRVEAELLGRALATPLGELEAIRAELEDLVVTVKTARVAADGPDRHGTKPGSRTRHQVSLADVVAAATQGWSLLVPLPATPRVSRVSEVTEAPLPAQPPPTPKRMVVGPQPPLTDGVDMSRTPPDPAEVDQLRVVKALQARRTRRTNLI
jgi:hypothetical protein